MSKEIKPNELKEGQKAKITHWVNQPQYVGSTLRMVKGELIKTDKNGFDSKHVDMRYPHFCKIVLI